MALLTLFCSPSGLDGDRDVCCPCVSGACCTCGLEDGPGPETVAGAVAGTSARFAGALFAVTRSDSLEETCFVSESELSSGRIPSKRGLPNTTNKATRAANTPSSAIRLISARTPSPRRAGGSGIGSGHKSDLAWWWHAPDIRPFHASFVLRSTLICAHTAGFCHFPLDLVKRFIFEVSTIL